ncbi:hypothetical protein [Aeoliella sp.]|uniref:hypothetical protein n=1 Tax=Aeoliella sp. TaxID=2795800 RepID=UPI003CCBFD2F
MKLRCDCGNVISDSTDNLPYKCNLLPDDGYWDNIHQPIVQGVLDFATAIQKGTKEEWLTKYFGEGYPRDLDDASVISDLVGTQLSRGPTAYQCAECGMILIPSTTKNGYAGFAPVDDDWHDVLAWRKQTR